MSLPQSLGIGEGLEADSSSNILGHASWTKPEHRMFSNDIHNTLANTIQSGVGVTSLTDVRLHYFAGVMLELDIVNW